SVRSDVARRRSSPIEPRAAPQGCEVRSSSVFNWNQRGNRSKRVAGGQIQRQCRVAQSQTLAVGRGHVAFRLWPRAPGTFQQTPIRRSHNDVRAETVLQKLRASGMIDMTVTDYDVFDFVRIKSDLWQSVRDFVFNGVIVNGIDEDNSVGCVYGPR